MVELYFISQNQALEVTAMGQGLKFETDEPHFITLGGGRLSVGVTMCPVKLGMKKRQHGFAELSRCII